MPEEPNVHQRPTLNPSELAKKLEEVQARHLEDFVQQIGAEPTASHDQSLDGLLDAGHLSEPMLRWFRFGHLPPALRDHSRLFAALAIHVAAALPKSAERTVALRKLLESKDAAVRAALP